MRFEISRIDDDRTRGFHFFNQMVHVRIHRVAESEIFARNSQPRTLEPTSIKESRVILLHLGVRLGSELVARIRTSQYAEQNRSVAHGSRHGAGGVLAVSNRNYSRAADQPKRRLDA